MYLRSFVCALAFVMALPPILRSEEPAAPAGDYVLQPFDLIKIVVFQEPDMEQQLRLSQESVVTLPLIGAVDLKGKTVKEAETLIRDLYNRDYLVNPQVNLIVLEYSRVSVNVLGSVNTPGSVTIPPDRGLRLLEAIAQAGGFNRLADRKHIKLTRTESDGKTATYTINADEIIQGTSPDSWRLQKADVIFVPERLL